MTRQNARRPGREDSMYDEAELHDLLAKEQIRGAMARYARGIDAHPGRAAMRICCSVAWKNCSSGTDIRIGMLRVSHPHPDPERSAACGWA